MIYTMTFNPSLDYVVKVTQFQLGILHRTQEEKIYAGGKGINVSFVLKELGVENTAYGFAAGFTGDEIINKLNESGISADFIKVEHGVSRINIKLLTDGAKETEINGQGPDLRQEEFNLLYDKLKKLKSGDYLVLSGNVPIGIPGAEHIYGEICSRLRALDIKIVIDAEGSLLRNTLCERPFLIKPNRQEIEKLFHVKMSGIDDICIYAKKLQAEGARNVLVSLAEDGAILLDEHGVVHRQEAPQGIIQNSVGSGDSLVAGFLAQLCMSQNSPGTVLSEDYEKALRLGVAAGSAGAFSIGLPDHSKIMATLQLINQSK